MHPHGRATNMAILQAELTAQQPLALLCDLLSGVSQYAARTCACTVKAAGKGVCTCCMTSSRPTRGCRAQAALLGPREEVGGLLRGVVGPGVPGRPSMACHCRASVGCRQLTRNTSMGWCMPLTWTAAAGGHQGLGFRVCRGGSQS